MENGKIKKAAVIGAGFVGSTIAYTLMLSGLFSEIALIDSNSKKAEGEVMDLNHGMPFVSPVRIYKGSYADCAGSGIIIITAGKGQKPGETRADLAQSNTQILKSIVTEIIRYCSECILLIVSNPVDVLTYAAYKFSGFPQDKVIGSGTVLDTARFKYLLGNHVGVDARNVHAYIIGEHGDTEVAAWSITNIAGIPMDTYCSNCSKCKGNLSKYTIYNDVKTAAYSIIERKGATYYAIALAVTRITEAIIRNESSILTVSSLIDGRYGLRDLCMSLPTVINDRGIERVLDIPLSESEISQFINSGNTIRKIIESLKI